MNEEEEVNIAKFVHEMMKFLCFVECLDDIAFVYDS